MALMHLPLQWSKLMQLSPVNRWETEAGSNLKDQQRWWKKAVKQERQRKLWNHYQVIESITLSGASLKSPSMGSLLINGSTALLAHLLPDTTSVGPVPELQAWYSDAASHWLLLASTNGKSLNLHKSVFSPQRKIKMFRDSGMNEIKTNQSNRGWNAVFFKQVLREKEWDYTSNFINKRWTYLFTK